MLWGLISEPVKHVKFHVQMLSVAVVGSTLAEHNISCLAETHI